MQKSCTNPSDLRQLSARIPIVYYFCDRKFCDSVAVKMIFDANT